MSKFQLVALAGLFICAIDVAAAFAVDESAEPPLKYVVKVGGKTVTMSEGQPVRFEGSFTNPEVSFEPQSYRVFPYAGVSFNYPKAFVFEADVSDSDAKNWTMSGNDLTIMYFEIEGQLTSADFANNMISEFGQENAQVSNPNAAIELGSQKLTGTTLRVKIASHRMEMDVYKVPSSGSKTRLFVVQDNLDDAGKRSKEWKRTLAMIKPSFKLKK